MFLSIPSKDIYRLLPLSYFVHGVWGGGFFLIVSNGYYRELYLVKLLGHERIRGPTEGEGSEEGVMHCAAVSPKLQYHERDERGQKMLIKVTRIHKKVKRFIRFLCEII